MFIYNACMSKIFFLEGLPGTGKSTIIEGLSKKYHTISEVMNKEMLAKKHNTPDQEFFLINDEQKLTISKNYPGVTIIDRSPLSTVYFNIAKFLLDVNHPILNVILWFQDKILPVLFGENSRYVVLYIDIDPKESLSRKNAEENVCDPWRNLRTLEMIRTFYLMLHDRFPNQVILIDGTMDRLELINKIEWYVQSFEEKIKN